MVRTIVRGFSLGLFAATAFAADPVDFEKEIKPILERSCVQCHGPDKQKGKLRMDTREALLKGGDSGEALVEGKPADSDFVRRIALDPKHEDVMPPKGKAEHLTDAEIELVKRWVEAGAPWPKGLIAVAKKTDGPAKDGPTASAEELAARTALAKLGIRVRPLATSVNWSRISFRGAPAELPAETWNQLRQIASLAELDLSTTKIGDEQLASVAGLSNLATLNLSQTAITDAGLDHLAHLEKLTSLNLYGTKITDAGLAKLAPLKQLRQIYLAGTGATATGVAALKATAAALRVDDGGDFTELTKAEPPAAKPANAAPAEKSQ